MKNKKEICILVQARLGSTRAPGKMLRPFNNTTLVDILLEKLSKSTIINKEDIIFSAYESELKQVAKSYGVTIFNRSEQSAMSEGEPLSEIYEWHNKLPYKYVVLINACNPLLKIETIDKFILEFINSNKEGGFAVFEKKTYYWDKNGNPELFVMDELEAFDIDYEWQFKIGEKLYKELNNK